MVKKINNGVCGNTNKRWKDIKNPKLFLLQSVAIWLFYFLSLYICFSCFPETKIVGLKPALSLLLFSTIGVIVSPGGMGAYQMISTQVLLFYGVLGSVSISFPWIAWGSQFITVILIGGLCFLLFIVCWCSQTSHRSVVGFFHQQLINKMFYDTAL